MIARPDVLAAYRAPRAPHRLSRVVWAAVVLTGIAAPLLALILGG